MKTCHACKTPWDGAPGSQPGRNETCSGCGADLHVCLNCRFYDPASANECRSSTAERVRDKDKRNFCDEFELKAQGSDGRGLKDSGDERKKQWDDLFK
ncbi:MAG TPA: hypothetical protein VMU88_10185 [bacterium]|nr:hypothetical protein [bacterium]